MSKILMLAASWLVRHAVWFIVVLTVLVAGQFVVKQYRDFARLDAERAELSRTFESAAQKSEGNARSSVKLAQAQLNELSKRSSSEIERSIAALAKEAADREAIAKNVSIIPVEAYLEAKIDAEIARRKHLHAEQLVRLVRERERREEYGVQLKRLRAIILRHRDEARDAARLEKDLSERRSALPLQGFRDVVSGSSGKGDIAQKLDLWQKQGDAIAALKVHQAKLADAIRKTEQEADKLEKNMRGLPALWTIPDIGFPSDLLEQNKERVAARIATLTDARDASWFIAVERPFVELLPAAAAIVIGAIVTPPLIKALLYFAVAPLATRQPPIRIVLGPQQIGRGGSTSAKPMLNWANSSVSRPIDLGPYNELLVHPEFIQSTPDGAVKDTKWFLSGRFFFTSLASGLVAVTRIRAQTPVSVVVSPTRDALSEITVLQIPSGAALVIQPRHIVGVLQVRDEPLRITSHWRLASLQAWLTLQLRYLVFHGAADLIVRGCRGVKVEAARPDRAVNQAATIGFSADLAYSVTRCETFASYLFGKQELFNDRFAGEAGYFVYEEMPHADKKAGYVGRNLEGLTDSALKIFGM